MNNTGKEKRKKPVIICIGTDLVSGDRLGPMVGELLIKKFNVNAYVYGNLESPITGKNYLSYISYIKMRHTGAPILAIDACVGRKEDIGSIKFSPFGLSAGGAVNKGFERIGDIGILGVVAENGGDNFKSLSGADSVEVESLAFAVAGKVRQLINALVG